MPPKPNTRSQSRLQSLEETDDEVDFESATEDDIGEEDVTVVINPEKNEGFSSLSSMMVKMQKEQHEKEDRWRHEMLQEQARRDQQHDEQVRIMLKTIEGLRLNNHEGNGVKAKKIDHPTLGSVEETTLVDFWTWKIGFEGYAAVSKLSTECDLLGRRILIRNALHPTWQKLWATGMLKISDEDDLKAILEKIEKYLRGKRNPILDRKEFYNRTQNVGETLDEFIANIKLINDMCSFADEGMKCCKCSEPIVLPNGNTLQEERLRDRIVLGLCSEEMQDRIFEEPFGDLTLNNCIKILQAFEASRTTTSSLRRGSLEVNKLGRFQRKSSYKKEKIANYRDTPTDCLRCGKAHDMGKCPAKDSTCFNCHGSGHWKNRCPQYSKQLNSVYLNQIMPTQESVAPTEKIVTKIGSRTMDVVWLLDSGAQACVMSMEHVDKFNHANIRCSDVQLLAVNKDQLKMHGKVMARLSRGKHNFVTEVYVVSDIGQPILSLQGLKQLGFLHEEWPKQQAVNKLSLGAGHVRKEIILSKGTTNNEVRNMFFTEFPDVFPDDDTVEPLRPMNGPPMEIELEPDAKPFKRYKANKIPYAWEKKVKRQLDIMEKKDVIETVPLGEVGDYVLGMVPVQKQGSDEPRITVDFSPLNKYVKRQGYPTKSPAEEVAQIPPGMKYFTTVDGRHGYWQVLLGKKSRRLTTFLTPWGHYRFKRNAMGLINAGDEHNMRGDKAIEGIENVKKIVEDIIIYDKDFDTHIARVREVVKRCQEYGITLCRKKAHIAESQVEWCGYLLSEHGYTISPRMVEALSNFPVPRNRTDVKSFCGLVQQFESLSPDLTGMMEPIRALMSPKSVFLWTESQQTAFEETIKELTSPRILAQYRPEANLRLETDAAQKTGFGYALWQQEPDSQWKLLRCGSRTVSDAESRYSVTESELVAVVQAVKKLRLYLCGKEFTIVVDHQPLISILNDKILNDIQTPRILRLKEKLNAMGCKFKAVWRQGLDHTVADVFSRNPVRKQTTDDLVGEQDIEEYARSFNINEIIVEDPILDKVKREITKDDIMMKLKETIINGFPQRKTDIPELSQYWDIRHSLAVVDDVILYRTRVVIPKGMRKEVLKLLHAAHQGKDKMLHRARGSVFWPGISGEVCNMVKRCELCEVNKSDQRREPLLQDVMPKRPGEAIAADLFSCGSKDYLVVTDKYSGWVDVYDFRRGVDSKDVQKSFTKWFMMMGVPNRLTTDNGPQFRSTSFASFCEFWGILWDPSSPYHHRSNGYAEAAVRVMKDIVKKICPGKTVDCEEFMEALLEYRNTPRQDGLSPAQRLFNRPMRTRLPSHPQVFSPVLQRDIRQADKKALQLRAKAKARWDTGSHSLGELKVGDIVRVQHHITKRWDLIAEVMTKHVRGRSYLVKSETGRLYWRNRQFLKRLHVDEEALGDSQVKTDRGEDRPALRRSNRQRRPPDYYQA